MEKERDLFFAVLLSLNKAEILRDIILIGGWCPLVYKEYFGNPVEISAQRTADLDILVPNPPRIHKEIDVSLILNKLGFDRKVSPLDAYEKYVHPDLEVEFLTPERDRGRERPDLSYGKANEDCGVYQQKRQDNCRRCGDAVKNKQAGGNVWPEPAIMSCAGWLSI